MKKKRRKEITKERQSDLIIQKNHITLCYFFKTDKDSLPKRQRFDFIKKKGEKNELLSKR